VFYEAGPYGYALQRQLTTPSEAFFTVQSVGIVRRHAW